MTTNDANIHTVSVRVPDDAWNDWDRRNEDALVIDSSFAEDE